MSLETESMAKFLQSYEWDYMFTVTPKNGRSDPLAFMRDVWDDIKPTPGWLPDSHVNRAFISCEPFVLKGLHVHGLIAGDVDLKLPWWIEEGLNRHIGRSRVELCRHVDLVASYCSKYVSKNMGGDNYDFYGNWQSDVSVLPHRDDVDYSL